MPIQTPHSFALLVLHAPLLLLWQLFTNIALAESSPAFYHAASFLQFNGRRSVGSFKYMQEERPLYVEVELPGGASRDDELDRGAVQSTSSSKLGRLQALHMMDSGCLGLKQWIRRASTDDIKMGRSYRRLLVGTSFQEGQVLWFKCHSHIAFDDDDDKVAAGESNTSFEALMKLSTSWLQSRENGPVDILQAFLISHPSFFLHLASAFLLLAFLASLLYFSLD